MSEDREYWEHHFKRRAGEDATGAFCAVLIYACVVAFTIWLATATKS